MIPLPDFEKAFDYENNFYLSCDITRISKILAQYELFKLVSQIPGAIVEFGVLKGASFSRFAMFREIFSNPFSKKILGFDIFGNFPETSFSDDKKPREKQITDAGLESISKDQLLEVLKHKGIDKNVKCADVFRSGSRLVLTIVLFKVMLITSLIFLVLADQTV